MSCGRGFEAASGVRLAGEIGDPAGCVWSRMPTSDTGTRVRIYTLGRFSVAIDGRQICSAGKAKQRPLALLKALIALGGRGVASSQVWECLWPDSEGDMAVRNLTVTLHRLRQLLGSNASIFQHDGKLTLNDQVCWVDAWSFERAANQGLSLQGDAACDVPPARRLWTALELYSGHFLALESEESWMLAARLKLRIKFERVVTSLVGRLERDGAFADAIDSCLQGLERDPLNEILHQSLMCCYLKSGQPSQVMRAYQRCREALDRGLGAAPSAQTHRLYVEAVQASSASPAQPVSAMLRTGMEVAVHGRRERQSTSSAIVAEFDEAASSALG